MFSHIDLDQKDFTHSLIYQKFLRHLNPFEVMQFTFEIPLDKLAKQAYILYELKRSNHI